MNCVRCGKEDIQIVSEYIETKRKFFSLTIIFLYIIFAIIFIIGFVAFNHVTMPAGTHSDTPFPFMTKFIVENIVGARLLLTGFIGLIAVSLISSLTPRRHITRIVAVCMNCGKMMILSEHKPETSNENEMY